MPRKSAAVVAVVEETSPPSSVPSPSPPPAPKKSVKKVSKKLDFEEAAKASDEEAPAKPTKPKKSTKKSEPKESGDEAPAKSKRTRKPSAYNILLGEFMRKIALEENDKEKEDRLPRGDRMRKAQAMYREWKAANPAI